MKKKTKLVIVLSSTLALLLGFAGVAYAADGAIPGDALYGLDCALEAAGIGDGGLEERLSEAGELIDNGQIDEGLTFAAEALTEEQDDFDDDGDGEESEEEGLGRREALLAAADAVLSSGSEQSLEVRTRVAEKLRWMATTELTGREFGQAVSRLARGLPLDDTLEEGQTDGQSEETKNGKGIRGKGKGRGLTK